MIEFGASLALVAWRHLFAPTAAGSRRLTCPLLAPRLPHAELWQPKRVKP